MLSFEKKFTCQWLIITTSVLIFISFLFLSFIKEKKKRNTKENNRNISAFSLSLSIDYFTCKLLMCFHLLFFVLTSRITDIILPFYCENVSSLFVDSNTASLFFFLLSSIEFKKTKKCVSSLFLFIFHSHIYIYN
jgi:hypothetical protein